MSKSTDELLKSKLTSYLGELEAAATKGGDFLAKQVPDVVQELIAWSIATSIMQIILAVILMSVILLLARWALRYLARDDPSNGGLPVTVIVITAVMIVVSCCLIGDSLYTLVKCMVAPKLFILDYVLSMLKSSN